MANWIRRNPQGEDDCPDPTNPACAAPNQRTTLGATATTEVFLDSTAEATRVQSGASLATNVEGLVATTGTNLNGGVWTSFYTITSTEALPTRTASTVLASATETPVIAHAESKSSSNDGVSKGAVAGIAIGTCIAGAAIAFIAAWLLFKRRDKKFVQKTCPSGYPIYADSSPELVTLQKSAAAGSPYIQVSQTQMRTPVPIPGRVPPSSTGDALAGILPPAANEHDIQNRVLALFRQIHRHVDTFYRDVHASITPSMDSDLASFGKDINMLELLQNCSSPTVALKHALVAFVLGTAGPKSEGFEQTIWPDELSRDVHVEQNLLGSDSSQLATAHALHRRLTVYLYTCANALTPQNRPQSRLSNLSALSLTRKTSSSIREAAEHFSLTFFPWANPAFGDQERESDLAGIIGEALECRIWLYGQTGEWGFEWEVPGRGAVVVAPALIVREIGTGPRRVVLDQSVVGV